MKIVSIYLLFLLSIFNIFSQETIFANKTLELDVHGAITPATLDYIQTAHKKAVTDQFDVILIKINTPGGLVQTTKEILTLFGASDIPIILWITPEGASATSAGALIASGAHLIFMSEGTNIGAATPIQMGKDIEQSDLRNKAVNDLVALVSSLSETRGRNKKAFSLMVSEAKSFSAKEAKDKKIIEGIANNISELKKLVSKTPFHLKGKKLKINMETTTITSYAMDLGQRILQALASPNLAYLLFILGAALIYFELQAPGGLIAGSVGAISLLLAGVGFQVLPLNFGAFGLIALSFVLFIIEMFVTSYGILSIAGLASLITGSLFLYRTDEAYLSFSSSLVYSTAFAVACFLAFMAFIMFKYKNDKEVSLLKELVGKRGTIIEKLPMREECNTYNVKVYGEIWKAISEESFALGQECKITKVDNDKMLLNISKI